MLFLLIVSFLFCGVLSTDTDLKETIELMKQEIQALKSARLMYNERLGELETQIRQGKTNFEMLSKLNNKRAKDQGLKSFLLQIHFLMCKANCSVVSYFGGY